MAKSKVVYQENQEVLVLKREFAAPIEKVFAAWTQANVLAKWFGPDGFTVSSSEINLNFLYIYF